MRRLQIYTVLLGIVLASSILAAALAAMWVAQQQEIDSWRRELGNVSLQLAEQTELGLSSAYLVLDHVADTVAKEAVRTPAQLRELMGSENIHQRLRQEARMLPQVDVVFVTDDQGLLLNSTRSFPPPPIKLADRDYFRNQVSPAREAVFISRPVRNKVNGQWTFYIGRRIEAPDGRFLGVAQVGFSSSFLSNYYGKIALGAGSSVTLYRMDLTILARWPENEALMGVRNLTGATHRVVEQLGWNNGVYEGELPRLSDGWRRIRRMGAVRKLARYPLVVNVTVTEDVYLHAWRQTRAWMLGIAACCLLAVGIAFTLLWRSFKRREHDMEQMEALKARAEAASAGKSAFLATISHEIRTPLTAIIGFAELLGREPANLRGREVGDIIVRNGNHLLGILNEILDISKIEAGHLELQAVSFAPSDIVGALEALLRPQAEARGIALCVEFAPPFPPCLLGDPMRWRQILFNLMSNAFKFTERGQVSVLFAYHQHSRMLVTRVTDTGIGMSEAEMAALFAPFAQAGPHIAGRFGGSGLGLQLARHLATAMGGGISVRSAPGAGSTFEARVRMATGTAVAIPPQMPVAAGPLPLGATVLLAEDSPDNRMLVAGMLAHMGLRCELAENGREALVIVKRARPDLILMDMQMPLMDGAEATRAIRKDGFSGPIVALTANLMPEDVQRYSEAGCDSVLAKPLIYATLRETLARALGGSVAAPDAPDLQDLVARFNAALPVRVAELADAIAARQWDAVARACHRLKGAAGSFGHGTLTVLARDLEQAMRMQDADAAARLMAAIDAYVCSVMDSRGNEAVLFS